MHRRHQHYNIPTEIVRSLVAIAETGSFSKAGDRLGLSQPAISAHIKRLQTMTGGAVFHKLAHGGFELTPLGQRMLTHARKLLDANDQILSLGGGMGAGQPIRVGIASLYVDEFLQDWTHVKSAPAVSFLSGRSTEVSRIFSEGFLDIACILQMPDRVEDFEQSWDEEFCWTRHPDFVLSPGAPIPLITWPGGTGDTTTIRALERAGMAYRIVFAGADLHARLAAAEAGIGLLGLPARCVRAPLVVANDYYLPKLDSMRAGVIVRRGFAAEGMDTVAAVLSHVNVAPGDKVDESAPAAKRRRSAVAVRY